MTTPESAQKLIAQPFCPTARLALTEGQATQCGLAERWHEAVKRREARARKMADAQASLDAVLAKLLERAAAEKWSQRRLAGKLGLPESTWRLIRARQVKPLQWLPRLRAAAQRVMS